MKEQAALLGITEVLADNNPAPSLPEAEEKAAPAAGKERRQSGGQQRAKGRKEEKYRNIKSQLKEKLKLEEQLKQLKDERQRKLEEFKQKMRSRKKASKEEVKGKRKAGESKVHEKSAQPKEAEVAAEAQEVEVELEVEEDKKKRPEAKRPPKYKNPKVDGEGKPLHRLNQSEFNRIFQRKVKNRNTSMDAKNHSKKDDHGSAPHSGHASGSSRDGSAEKESAAAAAAGDQKDRILQKKAQRKVEEREKLEKALQQIRLENYLSGQKAREKEAAMLRPSSGMKHSFGLPSAASTAGSESASAASESKKKIEEQYGMEEEEEEAEPEDDAALEDIEEEIEDKECDNEEIKKDRTFLKTMSAKMKTLKGKLAENSQILGQGIAEFIGQPEPGEAIPEETEDSDTKCKEERKRAPEKNEKLEGLIDCLASDSGEEPEEDEKTPAVEQINLETIEETHKLEERLKLLRQYASDV